MSDPFNKTQALILTETIKDLKESRIAMDARLRQVEQTTAETKIYFENMMSAMEEVKDTVEDLKDRASETKGTVKGFAIAASLGGGIGAWITKLLTGGGH